MYKRQLLTLLPILRARGGVTVVDKLYGFKMGNRIAAINSLTVLLRLILLTILQESVTSDADVLATVNVDVFPDGGTVSLESIFGNSVTFDAYGDVSGAKAVRQVMTPREN